MKYFQFSPLMRENVTILKIKAIFLGDVETVPLATISDKIMTQGDENCAATINLLSLR